MLTNGMSLSLSLLLLAGASVGASAQPFAEVGSEASSEMVGPQDLPGRPKRERPQPEEQQPESEPADAGDDAGESDGSWLTWDRATGDWNGFRTKLEDIGLSIEGSFTAEWYSVLDGGVDTHGSSRALLDINATLDMETAFGWQGGTIFADFYWIDGDSISADAGDFQGVSNIEADDRGQLAELWIEQTLLDGDLRIKFGKIEGNSEFGFVDAAGEFVNSSAGFSPTILPLPTYPDPSTGLIVSYAPNEWFSVTAGVMDGAATVDGLRTGSLGPGSFFDDDESDDYVWLAEANLYWDGGRAGVGLWHHTGDFSRFSGGTEDGSTGFYALAEHRVWSADDDRGIDLFGQFGWADDEISDAEMHFGVGLTWWGPCEARGSDATGLYVSHAVLSEAAGYANDETTIEAFYRFQATPFFAVKPDLQFIINPNGDSTVDDAIVAGVRAELVF